MPYITMRDGKDIYVRVFGRGKPCVLLHGFGMNSLHWMPFILPLARGRRFIMPDFRGFGKSHSVPFASQCVLTDYARDVEDVIKALGILKTPMAGLSMGAYTGLMYGRETGFKRVSRYLHMDQSPQCRNRGSWQYGLFGRDQVERYAQIWELLEQAKMYGPGLGFEELPREFRKKLSKVFGEFFATAVSNRAYKAIGRAMCHLGPLATRILPVKNWYAYVQITRAYLEEDYDMRASLSDIPVPVTVMVGERSEMYPPLGQYKICELVPEGRLVRFEKSGHALMLEQPVKFVREFSRFLGR